MTEFEKVLQECLLDLEKGASNVDDCLLRFPKHARQLEPILYTSAHLEHARDVRVSDAFKARVRTKLIQQLHAHPRASRLKPVAARSGFMFVHGASGATALGRLAASLAAIVLALLITGTAYAQSALPGDAFYTWKLASENAWRAVSPDPVRADLVIAERRVDELIAVRDDPVLYSQALEAYLETADRLKSEVDAENETRILAVLDSQAEKLNRSGILLPGPDQEVLPPFDQPDSTPPPIPTASTLPILETSQADPANLPQIVPTMQAPSEPAIEAPPVAVPTVEAPSEPPIEAPSVDIPTVEDPLKIIPTVEVPPLLP